MSHEHREVAEALVQFSKQPIEELRSFVLRFAGQAGQLPEAIASGERVVIEERVTFTIPDHLVEEFLRRLRNLA
jgi:hypothetical protein